MTPARFLVPVWCAVLLAACSGAGGDTVGASTSITTTGSTSSVAPATTASPSDTSTQPPGATTSVATTSTGMLGPTLDDGRPATFMAVTDDYEAVEVDTGTGSVVRRFGQRADAASLLSAEEIAPNVVDGVWRSASGDAVLISECCEPAAGRINYLVGDERLDTDYGDASWHGWWVVPSPTSDRAILTGYLTEIIDVSQAPSASDGVTLFENDGSGVGAIGWSDDGRSIHRYDEATSELVTWSYSGGEVTITSRLSIGWIEPDQYLSGLDAQAGGNLVSFLHTRGPDGEPTETVGVVYSPNTGELLAEFPVATGSWFGGYDPTGRYLIYTTPAGTVSFQGLGRAGDLADGYVYASW